MAGHIKLDRKILDWEWYRDINTKTLFLHCLLKANWKDGRFQGVDIPRGSFATSYQSLADETGLSVKNVRTAINHLKTTGEVAVNRHPKFSVITVKNYYSYQADGTVSGSQVAENRQTTGSQPATIEEGKKGRREEYKRECVLHPPTLEDIRGYCQEKGLSVDADNFFDHYSSLGWLTSGGNPVKDWKAKIRKWDRDDKRKAKELSRSRARPTGFTNFQQRDYGDMEELERQLLKAQERSENERKNRN